MMGDSGRKRIATCPAPFSGGLQSMLFPGLTGLNQEVGKTCLLTLGDIRLEFLRLP